MRNCNWNGSSKRLQLKWTQCLRPEIDRRTEATARHWRLWFHIRSNPTFLPLSPQLSFPRTTQSHPCPGCAQKCHLRQYSVLRAPQESWPSRGELGDHRQPCGSGVWRPADNDAVCVCWDWPTDWGPLRDTDDEYYLLAPFSPQLSLSIPTSATPCISWSRSSTETPSLPVCRQASSLTISLYSM